MMTCSDDDEGIAGGYDHITTRAQEVEAHTGMVTFSNGLTIALSQDLSGGCGGKIWECAHVMVEYFIQHPGLFENKKVVEIGSGTGLVGLAVAKLYPSIQQLIVTDQLPMMDLMQENIQLNKLQKVTAEILNWGGPVPTNVLDTDIILASDCIYLEMAFIPLIDTLLALTNANTVIYLMYKKRRKADKRFFQMAKKKFEFVDIQDDIHKDVYTRQGFRLFCVKRK